VAPPPPPEIKKKQGWGSVPKKTPLSIEEILKKKREADAAAAKVSLHPLL
jgi:ATP-dependent RNA helicase DDX23/PRP28